MADEWLESQIVDLTGKTFKGLTEEAFAECKRCRGRENGDCGGLGCRYFSYTATEGEKEAAHDTGVKFRKPGRGWNGAFVKQDK